ncbi:MAG TPA: enoyl-CoA hydratase-related protein, partial [Accumulibacter sp.]|nr:enoyl-CoA hydratase-related protein [Accumulibacter sp.]
MSSALVTYRCDEHIALLTVDNPPVNALSQPLRAALLAAVRRADADPQAQAMVILCAGRTFIAGADVSEFDRLPEEPHLPSIAPEPFASLVKPEDVPPWPSFPDPLIGKPFIQRQQVR